MALTDAQVQALIAVRTGDLDPTTGEPPVSPAVGIVATNIATVWAFYADRALIAPRLQSLYTQRDCLQLLLGVVQDEVDIAIGQGAANERLGQRAQRLAERIDAAQTEIDRIEQRASANRGGVIAPITKTAPVMAPQPGDCLDPPPWDANSPVWSGSPYVLDPWPPTHIGSGS